MVATADLIGNDQLKKEVKDRIPYAYKDLNNIAEFRAAVESIDCDELAEAFNAESNEDDDEEASSEGDAGLSDVPDSMKVGLRGTQKPNHNRWSTMMPAIKIVLKHFAHFYAIAVAVKRSEGIKKKEMKSTSISLIVQIADDLLSLMKIRANPTDHNCPGSLYTQLLFLDAVGDCFYTHMLSCVMGHNSLCGKETHGL